MVQTLVVVAILSLIVGFAVGYYEVNNGTKGSWAAIYFVIIALFGPIGFLAYLVLAYSGFLELFGIHTRREGARRW